MLIAQSDHALVTHHAVRDVMRRTKGRLQGRWAQACFQRHTAEREGNGPNVAPAIGLLGFADGSQSIPTDADERIFPPQGGTYAAVRLIRLKIQRWDRLSLSAQEDSIGSVFLAFCRDVPAQFEATRRGTRGQGLDEHMVAVAGGYFFCPPGVRSKGDYIGRELVT